MPENLFHDPLMYQGASDNFVGPMDPIVIEDEAWGIDCEAELAVITDSVKMGASLEEAAGHIRCLMLVNDVSLRNLIPNELAKGFGFIHGKPATAFSPVAVTPDELGDAWKDGKAHLAMVTHINSELFGHPNAGDDMQFNFPTLVAHAAKTRHLSPGTIIGSGTISNKDSSRGSSCLVEKRMQETLATGAAKTEFLHFGDHVRIEMFDYDGDSIFGAISQEVVPYRRHNA
jgi:fumarylacetoacetate (FAA) hydrolase